MPEQFPAAMRPASLDLPSPVSLSEFGCCSRGWAPQRVQRASSPECEVERGECCPWVGGGQDHPRLDVAIRAF